MKWKRALLLSACFIVAASVFGSESGEAEPETVYRQFLAAFKTMRSLEDRSIESYLSTTSQQKLAEFRLHPPKQNCDPCASPKDQVRMATEMRPYPGTAVHPVRTESHGILTLEYQWREPPGSQTGFGLTGTDVSLKVELVQEQGWKLKSESWVMVENPGTAKMTGTTVWSY